MDIIDQFDTGDTVRVFDRRDGRAYYGFLSRKQHYIYPPQHGSNVSQYTFLPVKKDIPLCWPGMDFYLTFKEEDSTVQGARIVLIEKIKKKFLYI